MQLQESASLELRVSVACFRWNGETIETIVHPDGYLPSAPPNPCEPLDATAQRVVQGIFATQPAYVEQLYTFSYVSTNARETVVTYIALFPPEAEGSVPWHPLATIGQLPERPAMVMNYATVRLRAKLEYTAIAFHLMPRAFTLAELQLAYESILDVQLDKRNFRRRMATSGMLEETADMRREGPHRPARLYRYSGRADRSSYLTPSTAATNQESTS
jgi:8-oxo-dGTP diphosphatase